MKRCAALFVLPLVLLAVSACGSGGDEAAAGAPSGSSGTAFPATVTTKFGDVTVDREPERVVALGWGDAETALALGVQPIGASDWLAFGGEGVGPWAAGLYDSPPVQLGTLEPSYEQIAALEPDLILDTKSSGDRGRYDMLSAIAPTIGPPPGGDDFKTPLEEQVTMVATALGVSGDEAVDSVRNAFTEAASAHPEFAGKSVSVAALSGRGWGAYSADTDRVAFMTKLGFVPNPVLDTLPEVQFSHPLSEETLDLLDADLVVVFPVQRPASDVESNPVFASIPAVREGRAVVFDDPNVQKAYSTNTVLSMRYALDTVVPLVADHIATTG
ncbi:iron-siderophore ABC transporter substrate-binding protein [Rhodococcus sp. HNM0569]|uniref:ABC transporter substrate-binding protein n=1 Tax=Rhodococcus sp. HNM0569 TaxID=2716340 RepID=UPI00146A5916|nr:iron-siderophore ABC transporter substrate-binding protein [Rhodococcus sp. HNM0569]NLU85027.1 iron-siderophore ABC transporter substrate-binding protein [Rhodococcus sp. HNM0569]